MLQCHKGKVLKVEIVRSWRSCLPGGSVMDDPGILTSVSVLTKQCGVTAVYEVRPGLE